MGGCTIINTYFVASVEKDWGERRSSGNKADRKNDERYSVKYKIKIIFI